MAIQPPAPGDATNTPQPNPTPIAPAPIHAALADQILSTRQKRGPDLTDPEAELIRALCWDAATRLHTAATIQARATRRAARAK